MHSMEWKGKKLSQRTNGMKSFPTWQVIIFQALIYYYVFLLQVDAYLQTIACIIQQDFSMQTQIHVLFFTTRLLIENRWN